MLKVKTILGLFSGASLSVSCLFCGKFTKVYDYDLVEIFDVEEKANVSRKTKDSIVSTEVSSQTSDTLEIKSVEESSDSISSDVIVQNEDSPKENVEVKDSELQAQEIDSLSDVVPVFDEPENSDDSGLLEDVQNHPPVVSSDVDVSINLDSLDSPEENKEDAVIEPELVEFVDEHQETSGVVLSNVDDDVENPQSSTEIPEAVDTQDLKDSSEILVYEENVDGSKSNVTVEEKQDFDLETTITEASSDQGVSKVDVVQDEVSLEEKVEVKDSEQQKQGDDILLESVLELEDGDSSVVPAFDKPESLAVSESEGDVQDHSTVGSSDEGISVDLDSFDLPEENTTLLSEDSLTVGSLEDSLQTPDVSEIDPVGDSSEIEFSDETLRDKGSSEEKVEDFEQQAQESDILPDPAPELSGKDSFVVPVSHETVGLTDSELTGDVQDQLPVDSSDEDVSIELGGSDSLKENKEDSDLEDTVNESESVDLVSESGGNVEVVLSSGDTEDSQLLPEVSSVSDSLAVVVDSSLGAGEVVELQEQSLSSTESIVLESKEIIDGDLEDSSLEITNDEDQDSSDIEDDQGWKDVIAGALKKSFDDAQDSESEEINESVVVHQEAPEISITSASSKKRRRKKTRRVKVDLAEALVAASSQLEEKDKPFFRAYFESEDADSEVLQEIFEDANLLIRSKGLSGKFVFDKKASSWFFII